MTFLTRRATMSKTIMTKDSIRRTIHRIVQEILERNGGAKNLAIIGIRSHGADIAGKIAKIIRKEENTDVPVGVVDITLYRDDFRQLNEFPEAKGSDIKFDVTGKDIILVDDVLYTGRTARAAIDVILDYGRPKSIQLAVLIDRGGRELPIKPDYVGRKIEVRDDEYINVHTDLSDGIDEVILAKRK